MSNRPGADQLDDTVEMPAITDDPPGWRVHGERSADGWVEIQIIELDEGELSGPYESPPRHAKPGHGSQS